MPHEGPGCPGEDEIVRFAAGGLPDGDAGPFEAHLDGCRRCQALLAEAARDSGSDRRTHGGTFETFAVGELVADRYRIRRFLARGGMGEVYEARDTWLDEAVALKTLIPAIADSPSALARFKAEVKLTRSISHENVCRVFDVGFHQRRPRRTGGEPEPIPFLTMELLEGRTLRTELAKRGPLPPSNMLPIARGIVRALAHAHNAGVVHRDFKSDNVMLVGRSDDESSRVVVTDFGLARSSLVAFEQPLTDDSRVVLGTLDYMAPEQVEGKPATKQSDIYAFGVVLFEMMTGQLPFVGPTPLARALARVQGTPRRPMDVAAAVGPAWQRAILRCLEVDPRNRFERVEDLLDVVDPGGPGAKAQPKPIRSWSAPVLAMLPAAALLVWLLFTSRENRGAEVSTPTPATSTGVAGVPPSVTEPVPPTKADTPPPPAAPSTVVARPDVERRSGVAAPGRPRTSRVSVPSAEPLMSAAVPPARLPSSDGLLEPFSPR